MVGFAPNAQLSERHSGLAVVNMECAPPKRRNFVGTRLNFLNNERVQLNGY
jgi:hypothetical protein